MEGDKFISSTKDAASNQSLCSNFFLNQDAHSLQYNQSEPIKHINDYDFNILRDGAYKDIDDKILKLEYKISKTEEEIESLCYQIQSARDINDYNLAESLSERKKTLELELVKLKESYNSSCFSARISGNVAVNISTKLDNLKKIFGRISNSILSKFSDKFSNLVEIRNSLNKLENINKNVDELMSMHIPYGESFEKYDQLSKYIVKANSIQAEISKFMR